MKKISVFIDRQVSSKDELNGIYQQLASNFKDRTLVLLMGEVGVGKTTSVQLFSDIFGCKEVASPSFAIHHRYETTDGKNIDHLDLYRLKDDDDLESTGFWDLFMQKQSIIMIEWADRLDFNSLPLNWFQVRIYLSKESTDSNARHIRIEISDK